MIKSTEGPEPGHENRHHGKEQKRDLGLDFHLTVTTSRCLLAGPGESLAPAQFRRVSLSIYSRTRSSRIATIFSSSPFPRRVHQFLVFPVALFFVCRPLLRRLNAMVNSTLVSPSLSEAKKFTGPVSVYFRSGQRFT